MSTSQRPSFEGSGRRRRDELADSQGEREGCRERVEDADVVGDRNIELPWKSCRCRCCRRRRDELADAQGEDGLKREEADVVGDRNSGVRAADVVGEIDGGSGALADENADGDQEDGGAVPIDEEFIDGEALV